MEYRVVDLSRYARRAHFDYFKGMAYPYVGVTCNVDITEFLDAARARSRPCFLSFLWCVARAANAVPELRQRILGEGIIKYACCPVSYTVARADGTYAYCNLLCDEPLEAFLPRAKAAQRLAQDAGIEESAEDARPLLFISTLPWLHYASLVQPVPAPADSNPRVAWRRYAARGERVEMPVSILCHHALVDGLHIAAFYRRLGEALAAAARAPDAPDVLK